MARVLEAVRELRRRPLRSALTVGGIAIGVGALVLLGALSERLTRLVGGGRDFATGQITVSGVGGSAVTGMTRGGLVSGDQLLVLGAVPGVAHVAPIVMFPVGDTVPMPFMLPPMVFGVDVAGLLANRRGGPPPLRAGRLVPDTDAGEVLVGSEVARHFAVDVGGTLSVRGQTFRVAGVLEPTLTGPDSFVFMPFPLAERLLLDSEPLLRRLVTAPGANVLPIATAAAIFWTDGEDAEAVAGRIRERLPTLSVVSPRDAAAQLDRALAFLSALMLGSALTALLVASLAVTNTMLTAALERRREIGLRRVVGATRRQVLRQFVVEAGLLGGAGSAVGLLFGALGVEGLNALTRPLGAPICLLTGRLVTLTVVLPTTLAVGAALWPAWRAARVAPSEAIRWA